MADNKSSEGKLTTLECMECGFREVFTERQFKFTDGLSCLVCNGPVNPTITRPNDKIRNRRTKEFKQLYGNNEVRIAGVDCASDKDKTISAASLVITADVSDALKGLKAVQREARKATAALKELESIRTDGDMAEQISNLYPITYEDASAILEAIMQGRTNQLLSAIGGGSE